ncbi:MAG: NAD(P)H-hydrate dehydratase [Anaerolineales bacterium]|nr:NAD(P)H-hydrate dehydratase [Anaerolineales bacterium]
MAKLVTVDEMVAIEQAADAAGWSYADMMQAAGASLAQAVIAHSHSLDKNIVALVGPGNNGGDALVALRLLAEAGWHSQALLVGGRPAEDDLLLTAQSGGVRISSFAPDLAQTPLQKCAVLLDGLLGTGMRLPLRPAFADALDLTVQILSNLATPPLVVAVDCPSGMDCRTGVVAPEALAADLTVCMAAVKQGMLTTSALPYLGQIEVGDIGLPPDLPAWAAIRRSVIDRPMVHQALPPRPLDAHKGTFGTALVVAGSQAYPGAALLAAQSAYRVGSGLVRVATIEKVQAMLAGHLPEAVWMVLPSENDAIAEAAAADLEAALPRATGLLLGPGLGQQPGTGAFVRAALGLDLPPTVIDADALRWLAEIEDWPGRLRADSVLTPHPGEMAALSGLSVEHIQADRLAVAERYAQAWGQVLVLKGAFTVVAAPDGRSATLPLATPALSRAGSGDVLAGILTGLLAQGVPSYQAACAAVWLHGYTGERALSRLGTAAGVLPSDLLAELPAAIAAALS